MTMPPMPLWYHGHTDIRWFLDTYLFTGEAPRRFRLRATRANASPAFAVYERDEAGVYRATALHVLAIQDGKITEINDFLTSDSRFFSRFGLSAVY